MQFKTLLFGDYSSNWSISFDAYKAEQGKQIVLCWFTVKRINNHTSPLGIHTVENFLWGVWKPKKIAWLSVKKNTSLAKAVLQQPVRSVKTIATVSWVLYLSISQRDGSRRAINLYFVIDACITYRFLTSGPN